MENRTWIIVGIVFLVGIIVLAAVWALAISSYSPTKPLRQPRLSRNPQPALKRSSVEEPVETRRQPEEPEVLPPSETPEPLPEFTSTPEYTATPEPVNRCELFYAAGQPSRCMMSPSSPPT